MFYRLIRSIVAFALGLFYRIEVRRKVQDVSGPVMFVCNHPNSLIDPALVFVLTSRQVTFLAREPLFRSRPVPLLLASLAALASALPTLALAAHAGTGVSLEEVAQWTGDATWNGLRASALAAHGVSGAAFNTTVQPAASAGASLARLI